MSIRGRIAVDVQFADDDTVTAVKSLKSIALQDATEYTEGKVAVVSGTVGTAGVTVQTNPMLPQFRDAAGGVVSFTNVSRVAFQSSRDCVVFDQTLPNEVVRSFGNCGVSDWDASGHMIRIETEFTSGTASYTLVLYGT